MKVFQLCGTDFSTYSIKPKIRNIMRAKELKVIIKLKNDIIMEQSKRIKLLEDKMAEIRQKYFRLKYSDGTFSFHHNSLES